MIDSAPAIDERYAHQAAESVPDRGAIRVAIPELQGYTIASGIGRVLHSLRAHWRDGVEVAGADLRRYPLPFLRGFPFGLNIPKAAELVFLPKMLGATALRDTGGRPSLMVVHDVGGMEKEISGDRSVSLLHDFTVRQHFLAVRHATHVVAVSDFTRNRLLHHLPALRDRVTVIPNGVDDDFTGYARTREEARHRAECFLGRSLSRPTLLYVGSESPRKNIPLLLQALKRLKRTHPQAQLVKIGRPDHKQFRATTLRTLEQLHLEKDVDIRDVVNDDTLRDLYRAADVFVTASAYEGFGLPALEAMALGTPVVTTSCGAFPEVIGDGGLLVEPNPEALARALETVLEPEARARWAERGKARAAQFSWARAARSYLEIMARLTHAARPS